MQLVFAQTARRDLQDIIDYIALENSAAAGKVFRAIVAVTRQLVDFPEMGHAGRLPDTRELAVAGLPYLIVYQVGGNVVTIIAVFHGARDLVRALAERGKATGK
ncbi:MAG: type II toxin-antitoxin system RelE/ParE family toxin [Rhodanobacteraceae bacterium]|nr:MAG: type II toxin-antitoxin system RelE/ParE family toxin [Rhodanobacteraceae bacterium]